MLPHVLYGSVERISMEDFVQFADKIQSVALSQRLQARCKRLLSLLLNFG